MPIFAAVNAVGITYSPFLMPRWTGVCSLLSISGNLGYYGFAALHAVANLHKDLRSTWYQKICPRTEFDEPKLLANGKAVTHFFPTDDAAREDSGYLCAYDRKLGSLYSQR